MNKKYKNNSPQDDDEKKRGGTSDISSLLDSYQVEEGKGYITREFQDYGYRLALELDDLEHKSLYIRMAKRQPRGLLERARSYVKDANARSKARLFMWKFKQLIEERKSRQEADAEKEPQQQSLL